MKKNSVFFIAVIMLAVITVNGQAMDNPAKVTAEMLKPLPTKPLNIDWGFLPKTVAIIDGKKITKQELLLFFTEQVKLVPYPINLNSKQAKKLAPQLVNQLVAQKLLTDLAIKAGFKPNSKLATTQIKLKLKKMRPEQLAMLKAGLTKRKQTIDQLIAAYANNPIIQSQYAIAAWAKSQIKPAAPSDAEIKTFYKKNRDNSRINQLVPMKIIGDPPNSIRASHILIKTAGNEQLALNKIKKILSRLQKGESFEQLARNNSDCGSAKHGGSLGAFKSSQMVKAFSDVAFALKVGEISGIVKTRFGYHIIRRDKSIKTKYLPYDKVKKEIADYIATTKKHGEYYGFIKGELKKSQKARRVKILVK